MKRAGNLWDVILSFESLHAAYRAAIKNKRYSKSAAAFSVELGENLLALRDELKTDAYVPGPYRTFTIYEPKLRLISAAPCFSHYQRRFSSVLKMDVEKYFPSIDHEILKGLLRRKVKCTRTLALADLIIDRSNPQEQRELYFPGDELFSPFERRRGLPIGNLTSQFFANVYLDPIDHFIKETLGCRGYVRYMDDLCLFSDSKRELHAWQFAVEGRLASLRLRAKPSKTRVFACKENIGFLGYRCLRSHRRLERGSLVRALRRLRFLHRSLVSRRIEPAAFRASFMSWLGHAKWANAKGIVRGAWD
ncbi:MAG: reverse transcriptase domain-containing protein [Rectinemataceae bacterium]